MGLMDRFTLVGDCILGLELLLLDEGLVLLFDDLSLKKYSTVAVNPLVYVEKLVYSR